jgi:hypothetical protein
LRSWPDLAHASELRLVELLDQPVVDDLRIVHHLATTQHRGARHIGRIEALEPVLAIAGREDLAHQRDALGRIG